MNGVGVDSRAARVNFVHIIFVFEPARTNLALKEELRATGAVVKQVESALCVSKRTEGSRCYD